MFDSDKITDTLTAGKNPLQFGKFLNFGNYFGRLGKFATKIPGSVQSRINVSNEGFGHTIKGHFNPGKIASKSQFTISQSALKNILTSKSVVQSPASHLTGIGKKATFLREVHLGQSVGINAAKFGGGSTNILSIISDIKGNLVSTFPGRLRR
ncbi:MAG: hypothetical protein G3M70_15575 [Candidatus Nitronauta litoralis]|uniref:Uncharacterized protein n=1 Tax=Candidatus Nitronauta litoralis TaxID=2705533 RepID=A0A7T0BYD1_9BACT|nr:MAG: hypothetical protein G3M70_15575 [Candidatus Nitronauta litoralis]